MKTKNKVIALLEITVVLCSVFLVAIPAIAADGIQKASASEVTTASDDDSVLDIYGNANEDDTIDMRDLTYVKLIFFGKKSETELADAKYDGKINPLDFIQIKLIIVGKEKELTLIDDQKRIVTISKPIERVICIGGSYVEALRSIKVSKDIIVGVPTLTTWLDPDFFSEFADVASFGTPWNIDFEVIFNLRPDLVPLGAWNPKHDATAEKLEAAGITVIRVHSFAIPEDFPEVITMCGYIFGKRDEAKEIVDWRENILNQIKEQSENIPEEDKPKVYFESFKPYTAYGMYTSQYISLAGGQDILPDAYGSVDPEAVIERDPDIIIKFVSGERTYGLDADDTARLEEIRKEIMNRPELQNVKAIKEGHVYVLTSQLWIMGPYGGNRGFIGIRYLAKWFHPELFEDLDPKAIHQEYITRFQGLDIDLDEKGVFVYPKSS